MNRVQSLLQDIADEVSTPPDLADRALARAGTGRRRSMPMMVAAAASVAVVVLGGTVVLPRLFSQTPGWADVSSGAPRVTFPERAAPLPEDGVAGAVLAYQPACADSTGVNCDPWRIMTAEHEHYELSTGRLGPAPGSEVSLSPSGDRLAYWRPDGKVVLHDLASGRTREQFGWDEVGPVSGSRYAWSPDGRWLLAVQRSGGNARLLDTEVGRSYDVGSGPEADLGDLSDGDYPKVFGRLSTPARSDAIGLDAGAELRMYGVDAEEVRGESGDGLLGTTSPNGSRLVTITFPDSGDQERGPALVTIVDLDEGTLLREVRFGDSAGPRDRPHFLGWTDDHHVLIGSRDRDTRAANDPAVPRQVDALDIRTGELERVLNLPDGPIRFDLAYGTF